MKQATNDVINAFKTFLKAQKDSDQQASIKAYGQLERVISRNEKELDNLTGNEKQLLDEILGVIGKFEDGESVAQSLDNLLTLIDEINE